MRVSHIYCIQKQKKKMSKYLPLRVSCSHPQEKEIYKNRGKSRIAIKQTQIFKTKTAGRRQ